ncbi:hypothetical protein [Mariniblastus fucicola]|uniref:Uncharacterized protein n=1 Tax=Mariniblastus fucicola TaxID=980251 RepID=A0A5B9PFC7_9BACT|nr:hypothetical protein [Mariniblastus fucicola]QEG23890.1 hypothetical protein MFFC18_37940 [Mariniblastus fucicola]
MNEPDESKKSEIEFHFLKSNQFRSIHCDGIFGGVGGDGNLHLTVYSERSAIPKLLVMETQDGVLTKELRREGKTGVIRDVEANLVLGLDTAVELSKWLQERLEAAAKDGLIERNEDLNE